MNYERKLSHSTAAIGYSIRLHLRFQENKSRVATLRHRVEKLEQPK